tara:strand:- start:14 stop:220 length:207 start_codon:yes stop_codon:yes gene_type:complete
MKTAVEFLIEQITDSTMSIREAFKQAKEMEKQQIIEAHGNKLRKSRGTSNCEHWVGGIDYYNETFKPE